MQREFLADRRFTWPVKGESRKIRFLRSTRKAADVCRRAIATIR